MSDHRPPVSTIPASCHGKVQSKVNRGDRPFPMDNRYSLDIATLAIFPEYVEFDGEEVLKLVVQGEAGKAIK